MVPAHFPLGSKARTEENSCRGQSSESPNGLEVQPRMTLSSASRGLKEKNDMSPKTASKALPEEKASRMRLAWEYNVGVVQGKDVTFALNAPTNVLATLMGKDP